MADENVWEQTLQVRAGVLWQACEGDHGGW